MKIFLSHNYLDKPVVEPIAIELSNIYGRDNVFYDSWSIQPGDGIIDMMNKGLSSPDFVFYFVSKASLASKMVDLEWQNALYKATKGQTKLIPVRVDGSAMPAILMQNVYIDMFSKGLQAATWQIVNLCQGNNSFTPQHQGFENLTYHIEKLNDSSGIITISASHLLETDVKFIFLSESSLDQFSVSIHGVSEVSEEVGQNLNNKIYNGYCINPTGRTIKPRDPLSFNVSFKTGFSVEDIIVMHHQHGNLFKSIPRSV